MFWIFYLAYFILESIVLRLKSINTCNECKFRNYEHLLLFIRCVQLFAIQILTLFQYLLHFFSAKYNAMWVLQYHKCFTEIELKLFNLCIFKCTKKQWKMDEFLNSFLLVRCKNNIFIFHRRHLFLYTNDVGQLWKIHNTWV